MNSRERILLYVLFGVLLVAGYGAAVYYFFLDDYLASRGQLVKDRGELDKRTKALADAENDQKRMFAREPRMKDWRVFSAPDLPPVKGGGKHTDDEVTRHQRKNQNDYIRDVLQALLDKHRFTNIRINAKPVDTKALDSKGGTAAKDKTPIMSRFPFTVEASGSYASIIDFLRDFYSEPLLHEVRTLTITKPATPRPGGANSLDLAMTVELLMVTGAEPRATLLPKEPPSDSVLVLAQPKRDYNAMLEKDPFSGRRAPPQPPDDPTRARAAMEQLKWVKLTKIFETDIDRDHERWGRIATFYNQYAGFPELRVHMGTLTDLKIRDDSGKSLLFDGKLAYIDENQVVLEEKGKYYLLRVGDFLGDVLERAPLSSSELKKFNLPPGKVATTKEADE